MSPSIQTYNMDLLDRAAIESLVWEALRKKWQRDSYYSGDSSYRAEFSDICMSVAELAVKKQQIMPLKTPAFQPYTRVVSEGGQRQIASVLWALVAQEILYIDMSVRNSTGSTIFAFDITDYGKQVIASEKPIPHDPDGYLSYLKTEIPSIDATILTYISEGISAYNHRLYLSATIAIGCASEKAFLLLLDSYIAFLQSPKEKESLSKIKNQMIKRQFEAFTKSFNGHLSDINKELTDGIDIVFNGIFELLRQNRNSVGHPTGKAMSREQVFASLQLFVTYCKRIYALIDYFGRDEFR